MKSLSVLIVLLITLGWVAKGCSAESPATKPAGMEVFQKAAGRIYCGSQPDGEMDFKEMAKMGIKLVISVDGAVPDVAAAKASGIRTIHLPLGYDAVPPEAVVAFSEALKQTDAPIFIHCHHGKHRGPAATAIAAMIDGTMDSATALKFLETSGTSKDYSGLWRDVREFKAVPTGIKGMPLAEVAKVEQVAEAMVSVDEAFNKLHGIAGRNDKGPKPSLNQGDYDQFISASMLLVEGMRESKRHSENEKRPEDLSKAFTAAEAHALELHRLLKNGDMEKASALFPKLKQDCKNCHKQFRDQ